MVTVPKVTVLMSVYNGEKYIREAMDSILYQTFKDFEFLIIDDGSTDRSADIIRSYCDPRIRFVQNAQNIGLTRSLNKGLKLAKGQYIARQDADDISLPERLKKQVQLLDAHRSVGLISSSITMIDETGKEIGSWKLSASNDTIKQRLLRDLNQFSHPSSMFRKECIDKVGPYREEFRAAQDYDLWLRIAEEFDVANLEEPLCIYRIRSDAISIKRREEQKSSHRLGHTLAIQRQIYGYDKFGYRPAGEAFRLLRQDLSKGFVSRRKTLSSRYLICAQNHAFMNGRRDIKLTLKYFLKSLINNPMNLPAWAYPIFIVNKKVGNLLQLLLGKIEKGSS